MHEITRHGRHWKVTTQICMSFRHARFETWETFHRSEREAVAQLEKARRLLTEAQFEIEHERHMRKQAIEAYCQERANRPQHIQHSLGI